MHARTARSRRLVVTCIVVFSLLLTACSFAKQPSTSTVATKAAEVVPTGLPQALETQAAEAVGGGEEATPEPANGGATSETETTDLESTLSSLVDLAPVHITASYEYSEDGEVTNTSRVEGDLDPQGNQHVIAYDESDTATEFYLVGTTMYMKTEDSEDAPFIAMEDSAEPGDLSILAMYGGAFLLAFNDLGDATKVGSESKNGFDTDKYQIKFDLSSFGLPGLVGAAQGAEWNYEGYAWIEHSSGALVSAEVSWSGKESDSDVTASFQSQFDATKADFGDIQPPENLLSLGDFGG